MTRVARKSPSDPYTVDWLMKWVIPEPNSGCWLWTGTVNPGGYGCVGFHKKTRGAHKVSYLLKHGTIPDGMDLDHLCRVRSCVNPDHLEPVTRSENLRRGEAGDNLARAALSKTHCPAGHPYSGTNLYICPRGHRDCVTCQRQRVRDWRARSASLAHKGKAA